MVHKLACAKNGEGGRVGTQNTFQWPHSGQAAASNVHDFNFIVIIVGIIVNVEGILASAPGTLIAAIGGKGPRRHAGPRSSSNSRRRHECSRKKGGRRGAGSIRRSRTMRCGTPGLSVRASNGMSHKGAKIGWKRVRLFIIIVVVGIIIIKNKPP